MRSQCDDLEELSRLYVATKDSFRVAQRILRAEDNLSYVKNTHFVNNEREMSRRELSDAQQKIDDLFVLRMWASFERWLINRFLEYVGEECQNSEYAYKEYLSKQIEYFRIDELLDLLKNRHDPELVGQLKQIKKYRDWVAHGHGPEKRPAACNPDDCYTRLSRFYASFTQPECQ